MTNEQENSEHPALEDDLFSGASAPVKPLFEQQPQASQPKPLFPADEEPADEAFIEQKLKEAGPTAFVSAPVLPPRPEAAARPSEEDVPSYVPTGRAADQEPVIVTTAERAVDEQHVEQPPFPQEQGLTATAAPEENRYAVHPSPSASAARAPQSAPAQPHAAPPLPPSASAPAARAPRYGTIRVREAVVPESVERNKRVLSIDPETATIGEIMRDARNQAGLTLEQAAARTCIKKDYIQALEADDAEHLPGGIFPSAYVRTLCNLYNLNDAGREAARRKVREAFAPQENVPEQLLQHLEQDAQRNEAEIQRVNKIFYLLLAGAAALGILLIAGVILIVVSLRGTPEPAVAENSTPTRQEERTVPVSAFDATRLETLTPPQMPVLMRILPVPSK